MSDIRQQSFPLSYLTIGDATESLHTSRGQGNIPHRESVCVLARDFSGVTPLRTCVCVL
jgi:hypothetical protein